MRSLSPAAIQEFFNSHSADPFLTLLTISHNDWQTKRFVRNNEQIVSRGQVYLPLAFDFSLPIDDGETVPAVKISLDNVDLGLVREFRSIEEAPFVKIETIFASRPDQIEIMIEDLKLEQITYDGFKIAGVLTFDDFLNTSIPSDRYTPKDFPGIF